jgi:hypothetical protein
MRTREGARALGSDTPHETTAEEERTMRTRNYPVNPAYTAVGTQGHFPRELHWRSGEVSPIVRTSRTTAVVWVPPSQRGRPLNLPVYDRPSNRSQGYSDPSARYGGGDDGE